MKPEGIFARLDAQTQAALAAVGGPGALARQVVTYESARFTSSTPPFPATMADLARFWKECQDRVPPEARASMRWVLETETVTDKRVDDDDEPYEREREQLVALCVQFEMPETDQQMLRRCKELAERAAYKFPAEARICSTCAHGRPCAMLRVRCVNADSTQHGQVLEHDAQHQCWEPEVAGLT